MPTRRTWTLPLLRQLPKLTDLTLASPIGGGGSTTGSGSTVFGLLLAVGLLVSGCSADRSMEPSAPAMPKLVAEITCTGDIAALKVTCGGPEASSGPEILGGQGNEVALRSSNVHWNSFLGVLTFDVSLQNLSSQKIGWTGGTPTGESVFFVNGPFADVGTVNVDFASSGGFFTAPGQTYYLYIGSLDPMQTSAPKTWQFHMNLAANTFTFTVMVSADVFDQGGVLQWSPVTGATQHKYNDVAVSSPTDWMTVGDAGLTARYTGGKWVGLPAIVAENINAVTAIGPGEYYAATATGAVLHFKNRVWTEIYRRGDHGDLKAIWAKDTSLIVAVGVSGKISRYSGGAWTTPDVATQFGGTLIAVSGDPSGTHISALNDAQEVWTSTGGGLFTVDPSFPFLPSANVTDLVVDAAGHTLVGWFDAVGSAGFVTSSTGDILWSGSQLVPQALEVTGTNKVAIGVGHSSNTLRYISKVDYSALPSSESAYTLGFPLGFDFGHLATIDAAATAFLVTTTKDALTGLPSEHLYRFQGSWIDQQGNGNWTDPDLWGIGDTVWALDGGGNFFKIVGGVLSAGPTEVGLRRLAGSSSTSFFAISSTTVWQSNGTAAWSFQYTNPGVTDLRDIWADPTGNAVIVLGAGGHVLSRISGSWSDQTLPGGSNALAVAGCNAHDAWIVTQQGEVYKWTDGALFLESGPGPNPLRAINSTIFCDPWAVGDNGTMYHRLGGSWGNRTPPGVSGWSLRAVTTRGAGQAIGAGDLGKGGIVSDANPFVGDTLPTQGKNIGAMWRLDNGEIYVAGPQLLLRGYR